MMAFHGDDAAGVAGFGLLAAQIGPGKTVLRAGDVHTAGLVFATQLPPSASRFALFTSSAASSRRLRGLGGG